MTAAGGVVVLVEGRSDAAVVEVLAERRGLDLAGVRVLPTGGAMGAGRTLAALEAPPALVLALCDEPEAPHVRRALVDGRDALLVCRADLEDELIRTLRAEDVPEVLAATGDLRSFRTLQGQPHHRGHPWQQQLHRFIGAGAGRKARIDRAIAARLPPGGEPEPLRDLLDRLAAAVGGAASLPRG